LKHIDIGHIGGTNNSITAIPIYYNTALAVLFTKVKIYLATNDTKDASHLTRIY